MFPIHELGTAVRARRSDMGLSQATLAHLAGLSRTTVNSLEKGSIKDLSLNRASKLLDVLGLSLSVPQVHPRPARSRHTHSSGLDVAARTANVSYKSQVTSDELRDVLVNAEVPPRIFANVRALLEDAPVATLARAVEQLHEESRIERSEVWKNMRALAQQMQVKREIFE